MAPLTDVSVLSLVVDEKLYIIVISRVSYQVIVIFCFVRNGDEFECA